MSSPSSEWAARHARNIPQEHDAIRRYGELVELAKLHDEARKVLAAVASIALRPAQEITQALVASELHRRAAWLEKNAALKRLEERHE